MNAFPLQIKGVSIETNLFAGERVSPDACEELASVPEARTILLTFALRPGTLRPGTVLGAKRWHLHLAELVSHRQVM